MLAKKAYELTMRSINIKNKGTLTKPPLSKLDILIMQAEFEKDIFKDIETHARAGYFKMQKWIHPRQEELTIDFLLRDGYIVNYNQWEKMLFIKWGEGVRASL